MDGLRPLGRSLWHRRPGTLLAPALALVLLALYAAAAAVAGSVATARRDIA
jgi:hypothetical protein